ncbi:PAS-domain containing protein [Thalassovita taeanensis]|uniref:PAS domain-containing protein n=1 Tax=Thalassovita taeanensis TaxID=657014 RepID=A0A1H9JI09_9RHOB|nr:PAS-domain containing protein [Thalassovita taeanensis]SEQ86450.1 PAS domain-containing protein [Thalassovita taeanensis]
MLDLSSVILVCAVSGITAGLAVLGLVWTGSGKAAAPLGEQGAASFLFDGSELINATESAHRLIQDNHDETASDWLRLRMCLAPRFPEFPENEPLPQDQTSLTLASADLGPRSKVVLENVKGLTRVTLLDDDSDNTDTAADLHRQRLQQAQLETLRSAVQGAPYPIWQSDDGGAISWANTAYENLTGVCGSGAAKTGLPRLFDLPDFKPPATARSRMTLVVQEDNENLWFDVCTVQTGDHKMHYATDVNAVVQAEIAQRNFVQTLTKTFAQLSIGLAIFDRKRQLALFNPALIDLTGLSADFLSARPNLLSFFDRLRDNRMMPEPKNYHSWRDEITDLVVAAADGRYYETWSLPSGLTYRVSGRPHPDGAIAFLFEDISAEISLTRRFRSELELGQSVLDHLDAAIAVFSSGGQLTFSNLAYRTLWGIDPDSCFAEVSVRDASRHWQEKCQNTSIWADVRDFVVDFCDRNEWGASITLNDGRPLNCRFVPINAGATMVMFSPAAEATGKVAQVETA